MTVPKVLISDKLSPHAADIMRDRGIEVDVKPGLSAEELTAIIGDYDGLAIRSATKVTKEVLAAATRLSVVGRAGIGVDNVDIPTATAKGVVVMNTPHGNSVTTAEHAITMMLSLARQIPAANNSTHQGKWEKSKFLGTEITGKVLGIIGCGNIGTIVADRAQGLKMRVIGFDPYLTPEHAKRHGIEKVELDELLARADFITLHTPLTDATRNIISADALNRTKAGVRIINCARGGLIDELALAAALSTGHVAGAALDVFAVEPATDNVLLAWKTSSPPRIWGQARWKRRRKSPCRWPSRWQIFWSWRGDKCPEHGLGQRRRGADPASLYGSWSQTWPLPRSGRKRGSCHCFDRI